MKLNQAIEEFFPRGVSRALIAVEQGHGCFEENTRVLVVNGKIYVGGEEGVNQPIGSRGGIWVTDIPDVTRIEVHKMEIEGVTFDYTLEGSMGVLIDVCDEEDKDEVMYYTLRYWEEYTKSPRYTPSALHTKLHWRVILERKSDV